MSFFLNEDMELLQESAREYAEKFVAPRVAEMEQTNKFPRDLYLKAGELGFLGLIVPEKIGGSGLGLTAVGVVTEEIAKISPAFAISYYVDSCMSSYLMESPNRVELLKKYLPGVMTGWTVMGAGITPPQGSTNLSEWPLMAVKDGDEWVLNGSKLYVTNTSQSDLVAFLGMTEEREMRCFFVETSDPGLDDSRVETKLGLNGNCSGSYFLTDVRVPDSYSFPKNRLTACGRATPCAPASLWAAPRPRSPRPWNSSKSARTIASLLRNVRWSPIAWLACGAKSKSAAPLSSRRLAWPTRLSPRETRLWA